MSCQLFVLVSDQLGNLSYLVTEHIFNLVFVVQFFTFLHFFKESNFVSLRYLNSAK